MLEHVIMNFELLRFNNPSIYLDEAHGLTMVAGDFGIFHVLCGVLIMNSSLKMMHLTYGNLIP